MLARKETAERALCTKKQGKEFFPKRTSGSRRFESHGRVEGTSRRPKGFWDTGLGNTPFPTSRVSGQKGWGNRIRKKETQVLHPWLPKSSHEGDKNIGMGSKAFKKKLLSYKGA